MQSIETDSDTFHQQQTRISGFSCIRTFTVTFYHTK